MSSGVRYEEGGFPSFGDDTYTYYRVDLRAVANPGWWVVRAAGSATKLTPASRVTSKVIAAVLSRFSEHAWPVTVDRVDSKARVVIDPPPARTA
jgi:hypothetical protein